MAATASLLAAGWPAATNGSGGAPAAPETLGSPASSPSSPGCCAAPSPPRSPPRAAAPWPGAGAPTAPDLAAFGLPWSTAAADSGGGAAAAAAAAAPHASAPLPLLPPPAALRAAAATTRVFVARIPASVTEAQFRSYFESFGRVQDAYMPRDAQRQAFRGIGFVTFAAPEAVEAVLSRKHWCALASCCCCCCCCVGL